MGITKTTDYRPAQIEMANRLKAMGHPARIAILEQLLREKSCVCGDLVNELPIAQATVSQHLKALKEAGIIQGTVSGNRLCYCIDPDVIAQVHHFLTELLTQCTADSPNGSCC
ncbi:MAG: ArsR/SmtB family transcription factor [Bacteroidota bacterium]